MEELEMELGQAILEQLRQDTEEDSQSMQDGCYKVFCGDSDMEEEIQAIMSTARLQSGWSFLTNLCSILLNFSKM